MPFVIMGRNPYRDGGLNSDNKKRTKASKKAEYANENKKGNDTK